jgi:DNA-binding YbaB/EbfC family protein
MDISQLMKQAQELQKKQADLSNQTSEATDPSGKVTVVATGGGDLKSLTIDPSIVSADDSEFLSELVLATANKALTEAREAAAKDLASNFNIPGMG